MPGEAKPAEEKAGIESVIEIPSTDSGNRVHLVLKRKGDNAGPEPARGGASVESNDHAHSSKEGSIQPETGLSSKQQQEKQKRETEVKPEAADTVPKKNDAVKIPNKKDAGLGESSSSNSDVTDSTGVQTAKKEKPNRTEKDRHDASNDKDDLTSSRWRLGSTISWRARLTSRFKKKGGSLAPTSRFGGL